MKSTFFVVTALTVSAAAAMAQPIPSPAAGPPGVAVRAVVVARGLEHPWSLAFLPDGRMLVTEKAGRLRLVDASGRVSAAPLSGVPQVDARSQGGLFDVVLANDFATSRRLFLSYAEPGSGDEAGRNGLAVGSAVLDADGTALTQWQVIYRHAPKVASNGHFGGRLVLAPDGKIFVTLGDRMLDRERDKAQDLSQGHGKVMRIASDGSAAPDNPFVGRSNVQPAIYSYGHRNAQGAALQPGSNRLWLAEHGPQGGDEINLVQPGRNYGWPRVSYGCEYGSPVGRCEPVGGASSGAGFEPPLAWWVPTSIGPSGLVFYNGLRYPEWRGHLFTGALAGKALWRIELDGDRVVKREALLADLNERIRDVRQGPDGWLYLLTDSRDGRILRLER